ncbi:hypothetical protein JMUB7512_27970 [Staphylococcus aureus]
MQRSLVGSEMCIRDRYTCAYVLIRMFKNKPAYEDVNRLAKKQGGEIEK